MKQAMGLWCLNCWNNGQQHKDQGRTCIRCLREVIDREDNKVEVPLKYEAML